MLREALDKSFFGFALFCTALWMAGHVEKYQLWKTDWQCTQSVVVKETLPREEECVQYTKRATESNGR